VVRAVRIEDLGAWLVKANGNTSDIVEVAARREPVRRWCVQPSYRTALMAAAQPVLFWVSGDRRLGPGLWAVGELTGPPALDADGERPKLRVPLAMRWLAAEQRIARDVLLADGRLAGLEVLRQPQAANPSFVTKAQLEVIREHGQGQFGGLGGGVCAG
jgi:hypothetical protein